MDTQKTQRTRRKESRPGEILDAAFEEFVEKGFAATRVEDIAERVGVTKGTVYVYFKDKEALFDATARNVGQWLFTAMDQIHLDPATSCRDQLLTFLKEFYRIVANDRKSREILRLMLAEGRRFPGMVDRHYNEFFEPSCRRLQGIVKQGILTGEFRESNVQDMPEIFFGPSLLMTIWSLMFEEQRHFNIERYVAADLDLLMHGLATRPAASLEPIRPPSSQDGL